jgi:phosphatidate cytidylyltransferase
MSTEATAIAAKKPSDLGPRLVVAAIGIPALLGIAFYAPNFAVWALLATAATIGAWEYQRMTLGPALGPDSLVAIASTAAFLATAYWVDNSSILFSLLALSVVGQLTICMRPSVSTPDAAPRFGHLMAGTAYTSVLFGSLILLTATATPFEHGATQAGWLLWPMIVIWSGDTGAYFAGRALGRHKLAPRISPAKTWEGAAGGLVASIAGGFFGWYVLPLPDSIAWWMVLLFALPGAMVGQLGDLAESLLKRSVGVKDSSRILYGHGGMLDRVDALIFAGPWFLFVKELLYLG